MKMYSVNGGLAALIFILFSAIFRVLLPFGDEPDFMIRAADVSYGEFSDMNPYGWISVALRGMNIYHECVVETGVLSLSAKYRVEKCVVVNGYTWSRYLVTILIFLPLIVISIFPRVAAVIMGGAKKVDYRSASFSIALSLTIPGAIYYAGVLSQEQFTFAASLFVFLLIKRPLLSIALALSILSLDLGNGFVVFAFLMFYYFAWILRSRFGDKTMFLVIASIPVVSYIGSVGLGDLAGVPVIGDKVVAITDKADLVDFRGKYPLILRPVITFMTAVFMTPYGLKSISAYVVFLVFISWVMFKGFSVNRRKGFADSLMGAFVAVVYVVSITFVLPDYSNAKYYIFLLPFLLTPVWEVAGQSRMIFLTFSMNILVLFTLIFAMT